MIAILWTISLELKSSRRDWKSVRPLLPVSSYRISFVYLEYWNNIITASAAGSTGKSVGDLICYSGCLNTSSPVEGETRDRATLSM